MVEQSEETLGGHSAGASVPRGRGRAPRLTIIRDIATGRAAAGAS